VNGIAVRQFRKALYGDNSPYARHPEHASIAAVTRQDLIAFHRQAFWPGNAMLGIVGDFDAKTVRELIKKTFGGWSGSGTPLAMPPAEQAHRQTVYLVDKPDVAQTQFRIGHVGGRRDAPDYYAMGGVHRALRRRRVQLPIVKEVRTRSVWPIPSMESGAPSTNGTGLS
jgi:zinc protease